MRTTSLALLLLPLGLTGCDLLRIKAFVPCPEPGVVDSGDGGTSCPLYYQDADGDGYGDPSAAAKEFCGEPDDGWVDDDTDCDDGEARVNPGATEICNDGVDDDCDSLADGKDDDLDPSSALPWYPDFDGDGYGDDAEVVYDCEAPVDHTDVPGDCNDSDPYQNPAAPEICNEQDDDCDTLIDDEDDDLDDAEAGRWWPDEDGDGWAAEGETLQACIPPEGYVDSTMVGDCDDTEPLASPGLPESCDDDIDNDCDGDVNEDCVSALYGTFTTDDLSLVFVGSASGDASGWTLAGGGDLDGDDHIDLVIGAYRADSSGLSTNGSVYVLPGPWDEDDGSIDLESEATAAWRGENDGDNAGVRVSIVGDVDDDGYDDLLVGADGYQLSPGSSSGRAYLVHGPATTGGTLAYADTVFDGPDENAYLGRYLAPAGDVNDDGHADLLIGAYGATDLDGLFTQPGVIYLYLGPLDGTEDPSTADRAFEGIKDSGRLSTSTAGRDLTGDGLPNLVFAAHGSSQVYVMPSPLTDDITVADAALLYGETETDNAGFALASPGDVDGDGENDLLVGAYDCNRSGSGAGAAYLMRGPITGTTGLTDAVVIIEGDTADDAAGLTVADAGDLDGDGWPDIAISAPWNDEGASDAGVVAVFYGGVELRGTYAMEEGDLRFTGSKVSQFLGYGLAGLGDLDGDGLPDLGMGSWNVVGGESRVYFGGSDLTVE
ncbi:MAG: FG-GAP repeat protein [Alphaproteobacteria bacterium]|nr:FG-GAP repeat protein [Alphaproteobacteria bacterium]